MASGRMIQSAIATDKKINGLSCDTSRLAFTWLITFADCSGRTYGDPAIVRSMLFPRRDDVTIEQVEGYIREWAAARLVYWYEASDDLYIQFVNFEKNQPGLRKEREAPSRIPPYIAPDDVHSWSGVGPELVPVKLKEVKRREGNSASTPDERALSPDTVALKIYIGVTGMLAFPGGGIDRSDVIYQFWREKKSIQATIDYLKPFFEQYCRTRGKNGKYYNKTGMGWLDWALTGELPEKVQSNSNGRNHPKLDY